MSAAYFQLRLITVVRIDTRLRLKIFASTEYLSVSFIKILLFALAKLRQNIIFSLIARLTPTDNFIDMSVAPHTEIIIVKAAAGYAR